MTRIRYNKVGNELVSKQTFLVQGKEVNVVLDLLVSTYSLIGLDGSVVLSLATKPTMLKKAAKAMLVEQGVQFDAELRQTERSAYLNDDHEENEAGDAVVVSAKPELYV
jgi:hypothetical protein